MNESSPLFQEPSEVPQVHGPVTDWTDAEMIPEITDGERLDALASNVAVLSERVDALAGAVNQFGEMLQYIVNTVAQAGQAIQKGGIGGIMSLMGGKNE